MKDYPNKTKQYLYEQYKARINNVIDYIQGNLNKELSLDELAKIANFSKYHFHRIFSFFVGETLFKFIQRLRIEKAAFLVTTEIKKSLTEISLECGFSSSSIFSRTFKEYFNTSPSEWRNKMLLENSNISKTDSKLDQLNSNMAKESFFIPDYNMNKYYVREANMDKLNVNVSVKELPKMDLIYIRHIGPYAGDGQLFKSLFKKLMNWAGPRGLVKVPDTKFLCIYIDNPEITDVQKLRMDVCITVDEDVKVDGEIGKSTIQAGKYAVGLFKLKTNEHVEAWNYMMGKWLPESGYQFDERPFFEMYSNKSDYEETQSIDVDVCIPIKPM